MGHAVHADPAVRARPAGHACLVDRAVHTARVWIVVSPVANRIFADPHAVSTSVEFEPEGVF